MLFAAPHSAKLIITFKDSKKQPLETDYEYGNFAETIIDLMHTYYSKNNLEWRYEASIVTLKTPDEIQAYTKEYKELIEWTEMIRLYYKDSITQISLQQFENLCKLGNFDKGLNFSQSPLEQNKPLYAYEVIGTNSALIPTHYKLQDWSSTTLKEDTDKYFETFKHYILETIQCKRFFGVPIHEIETITMKLC